MTRTTNEDENENEYECEYENEYECEYENEGIGLRGLSCVCRCPTPDPRHPPRTVGTRRGTMPRHDH